MESIGNATPITPQPQEIGPEVELAPNPKSASARLNQTQQNAAIDLAKNEFQDLLEDIRATPHHVQVREQRIAYKRLMNHLDGIEKKNNKQWMYWRRFVALLIFSALTASLVCSLTTEPVNRWRLLNQRVWQWITMTIMVTAVFSVVPFLTFLFTWPAKRYWKTTKYTVYFIRRLKRSVDVTIWACIVLTGWYLWFRRKLKHVYGDVSVVVVSQVTRFLIALCIGSLLWTIKTALQLKLKADLHYDQLFDRITQTIVYLNGVNVLDGEDRIPVEFLKYNNYEEYKMTRRLVRLIKIPTRWWFRFRSKGNDDDKSNDDQECKHIWMDVKKMRRDKVPIWILQRLTEEYLKEVKLLRPSNADLLLKNDDRLLEEAKRMFDCIVTDKDSEIRRKHLDLFKYGLSGEELDEFFKSKVYDQVGSNQIKTPIKQDDGNVNTSTGQEAQEDGVDKSSIKSEEATEPKTPRKQESSEKSISKDKFINWAVRAHKNCWSLEPTVESSKTAFGKLNRMLSAFLLVLMAIIWLLLTKIVNTGQLALLFAPFLAASFMFENSSMKMFHGIIFAFAMHPFDVGDRVIIEDTQMRVKELNIMTSVFVKYDTGAEVIFPNSKLVTTKIVNLDITPDQSDKLEFIIKADTPLEDIKDLELQIQKLLDDHLFYSSETNVVKSSYPENKEELKMTVHFKYLVSYLTAETKAIRRSEILSMIMKFRKDMEDNKKDYILERHVTYHLELTPPTNVKLSGIEHLKHILLRSLDEKGYKYCKVVMTDLKDDKLKMALYVSKSENMSSVEEDKIMPQLQSTKFFTRVDKLLSECGFTKLRVARHEKTIYPDPNLRDTFRRIISLKGQQGNPSTGMEQQPAAPSQRRFSNEGRANP